MKLGKKIQHIRRTYTFNPETGRYWTAEKLGIEAKFKRKGLQGYISRMERGERIPNIDEIKQIAVVLNVRFTDLVDENDFDPELITRLAKKHSKEINTLQAK